MDMIVLFRIGERLTLTLVVLVISFVVMGGFWRSVQKFDLKEGGVTGLAGSFVFSTPVFVLLAIIGYAWVSLEHPITVGAPEEAPADNRMAGDAAASQFVGMTPGAGGAASDGHGRALAERKLRSLNCIAAGQDLSSRSTDDLVQVKLDILTPYWQPDWGDPEAFAGWATGRSADPPDPAARTVWEQVHPLC